MMMCVMPYSSTNEAMVLTTSAPLNVSGVAPSLLGKRQRVGHVTLRRGIQALQVLARSLKCTRRTTGRSCGRRFAPPWQQ